MESLDYAGVSGSDANAVADTSNPTAHKEHSLGPLLVELNPQFQLISRIQTPPTTIY